MKQYISIFKGPKEIYMGRISDIPIKQESIINKSIALFDDDDPCIIHQSYVIKEYVDVLLGIFKSENKQSIHVRDHLSDLSFLDFTELEQLIINLKG